MPVSMKRISNIFLIIAVFAGLLYASSLGVFNGLFSEEQGERYQNTATDLVEKIETTAQKVKETAPVVHLDNSSDISDGPLDENTWTTDIVYWTNVKREENGRAALTADTKLAQAAQTKAEDILGRQYFEHTSPSGLGASDLAAAEGYSYILIGENLALGNFEDGKAMVEAWMDSPGHRANILKSGFTEIGVAITKGEFEGRMVYVGVQIFGTPTQICTVQPDPSLKEDIDNTQTQIDVLSAQLDELKAEMEAMRRRDPEYNKKVDEYNELARTVNELISEIEYMINTYNNQVNTYNQCVNDIS